MPNSGKNYEFASHTYAIGIAQDQRELRVLTNCVLSELYRQDIGSILGRYFPQMSLSKSLQMLFRIQQLPHGRRIVIDEDDKGRCAI